MFTRLIESRRPPVRRTGGAALSVMAHGMLVGGAVLATATSGPATPVTRVDPPVEVIYFPEPKRCDCPPDPTTYHPTSEETGPIIDGPVLEFPPSVPPTLPPIGTGRPIDDGTVFTNSRPLAGGVLGPTDTPRDFGGVLRQESVDRVAALVSDVRPRYPDALRSAGVSGRVVVRFVVDTTGRVEPGSERVLTSSHAGFENAVRDVLPRLRFRAAEVGTRRVRMLVEMPFEFTLSDR